MGFLSYINTQKKHSLKIIKISKIKKSHYLKMRIDESFLNTAPKAMSIMCGVASFLLNAKLYI